MTLIFASGVRNSSTCFAFQRLLSTTPVEAQLSLFFRWSCEQVFVLIWSLVMEQLERLINGMCRIFRAWKKDISMVNKFCFNSVCSKSFDINWPSWSWESPIKSQNGQCHHTTFPFVNQNRHCYRILPDRVSNHRNHKHLRGPDRQKIPSYIPSQIIVMKTKACVVKLKVKKLSQIHHWEACGTLSQLSSCTKLLQKLSPGVFCPEWRLWGDCAWYIPMWLRPKGS